MKNRLLAGIFFVVTFLTYVILSVNEVFIKLRVPVMSPAFADLRLITSTAECVQNESHWSLQSTSCDPWNRPFNLPSLWAKLFAYLDLTESKTSIIGYLFVLMFSLAAAFWFHLFIQNTQLSGFYRFGAIVVLFSLFISPPVLLLLERGNVDVLIFIGITFSVFLLRKNTFAAAMLVTILGGMKLFPWAGLLFIFRSKFSKLSIVMISLLLLFFGFYLAPELGLIRERSTTDFNGISFGVSLVPQFLLTRLGYFEAFMLAHLIGALGFFLCAFTYRRILPRVVHDYPQAILAVFKLDKITKETLILLASVFLGTYLVGTSYDYRLVFIIPLLISISSLLKSKTQNFVLGCFALLVLYNSYWFPPFIGIISDLALAAFAPLIAYMLYELLRNDIKSGHYRQ